MTIGHFPDGKIAFKSQNLAGLIRYGRKHGIDKAELGDCISGDGLYKVTFGNGVVCKGTFASPSVMLGFFLGRSFVVEIECDRTIFNKGAAMGNIQLPSMCPIGRNGTMRFGPWRAMAYRDATQTPLVIFTRPLR
jgi:hypothetical protein